MVADALSRSQPPREQDQEMKKHKIQAASVVEGEASQTQDQDQSFVHFIQSSTISLSKTQMQQFLKAQSIDLNIINLLAQSKKELKW